MSSDVVNHASMMRRIVRILEWFPYKYLLVAVILAFQVGKLQPFATFPVYSHIPPTAEYYYITDENNTIIPIEEKFRYTGGELHKMIEYRYEGYAITYGDPKILLKVGTQTLDYLFEEYNINAETVPYSTLIIWNAKVSMADKKIKVTAVEIARKEVK